MRGRARAAFLCGWYCLAAGNAPLWILEAASPSVKEARGVAFQCLGHGCGCITLESCLQRCCCFPRPAGPRPASQNERGHENQSATVEALFAAGCSGAPDDGAGGPKPLSPHVLLAVPVAFFSGPAQPISPPAGSTPAPADLDPPGKVPIARLLSQAV